MKICLDPGHGGKDPGAVGKAGLTESSCVLAIGLYVRDLLLEYKIEVKMTRDSDVFVELAHRCAIANNWGADYFVSIHLNSDGPSAEGIETLYVSDNGKKLADPIQTSMVTMTGDRDRGLKYRSDLYVLNGTKMPSALAEAGFISNPETELQFRTNNYRTLVAQSIGLGIVNFLGFKIPDPIK